MKCNFFKSNTFHCTRESFWSFNFATRLSLVFSDVFSLQKIRFQVPLCTCLCFYGRPLTEQPGKTMQNKSNESWQIWLAIQATNSISVWRLLRYVWMHCVWTFSKYFFVVKERLLGSIKYRNIRLNKSIEVNELFILLWCPSSLKTQPI